VSPAREGPAIRRAGDALLVGFRVSPSAARTAVKGLYGDRVKVAINAPAEDGRANAELIEALARWMGLMRDNIRVKTGHASRDKVLSFEGIEEAELGSKLAALVREDRSGR
jgi:uncharacterized protein (TIGR00251 family)